MAYGLRMKRQRNRKSYVHNDILDDTVALEFFLSNIDIKSEDECWPWTGTLRRDGIFRIKRKTESGMVERSYPLTGMLYILVMDEMYPRGVDMKKILANLCGTENCMNPTHYELGTRFTFDAKSAYDRYMSDSCTAVDLSKEYGLSIGSVYNYMNRYASDNGLPVASKKNRS